MYHKKNEMPIFNNIDIFNDINALQKLQDQCSVIKAKNNSFWLFPDIGIYAGGLSGEKIPEGKLLIVSSKNRLPYYEIFLGM